MHNTHVHKIKIMFFMQIVPFLLELQLQISENLEIFIWIKF